MIKTIFFWTLTPLIIFSLVSALLYLFTTPKQKQNWTKAHAVLASFDISGDPLYPSFKVNDIRDFKWDAADKIRYESMNFELKNVIKVKAVVSHFAAISEIAHVFLIFELDDGRQLGISIEARREVDESFSLSGGLLAQFELIYVVATPDDLLGIRRINKEATHVYPLNVSTEKVQQLFLLISKEVNSLREKPQLYHLFFKNCTNQIVKHVSKLTDESYPWFFQTIAPGNTSKILFDLNLIDMPNMSFEEIQTQTLVKRPLNTSNDEQRSK